MAGGTGSSRKQKKKSRKFPLGNSLVYISFLSVVFGRVRPGGRTLFLFYQ